MEPFYEGKAKKLFTTDDPNVLRMEFKDDATAIDAEKKSEFENKGKINKAISLLIYEMLEDQRVPTHLVDDIDEVTLGVQRADMILVEVIVRNVAAGRFSKRTGVKEGTPFKQPIVEFSYKCDELGDPMINDDYARELGLATPEESAFLKKQALVVNLVLLEFFKQCGMSLVDFKIEFGRTAEGDLLLADEISPDTCRLWDIETGEKMDKDRFREDVGGVMDAYKQVLERVQAATSPVV